MESGQTEDPTAYIDEIFGYDQNFSDQMMGFNESDGGFLSGSCAEGASSCRAISENKVNFEIDVMRPFGKISKQNATEIIVSTEYLGYYQVRINEKLLSCLDVRFSEHVKMNKLDEDEFLNSKFIKLYHKMREEVDRQKNHLTETDYKEGTPNIYTNVDAVVLHTEIDYILCLELSFWPDIVSNWLARKRQWPSPELMNEVNKNKCHLVIKSSPEAKDRNDLWRISFSKAESILAKGKSIFQKKCYLLAKFFYYAELKKKEDVKTYGRQISSYVLKTTMLHMLEKTCPQDWLDWEQGKRYVEAVDKLYENLIEFLSNGYLPLYFVEDMNLLAEYSNVYLKIMIDRIQSLRDGWKGPDGEEFFHASVKSIFHYVIYKRYTPESILDQSRFLTSLMPTPRDTTKHMKENKDQVKNQFNSLAKNLKKEINSETFLGMLNPNPTHESVKEHFKAIGNMAADFQDAGSGEKMDPFVREQMGKLPDEMIDLHVHLQKNTNSFMLELKDGSFTGKLDITEKYVKKGFDLVEECLDLNRPENLYPLNFQPKPSNISNDQQSEKPNPTQGKRNIAQYLDKERDEHQYDEYGRVIDLFDDHNFDIKKEFNELKIDSLKQCAEMEKIEKELNEEFENPLFANLQQMQCSYHPSSTNPFDIFNQQTQVVNAFTDYNVQRKLDAYKKAGFLREDEEEELDKDEDKDVREFSHLMGEIMESSNFESIIGNRSVRSSNLTLQSDNKTRIKGNCCVLF